MTSDVDADPEVAVDVEAEDGRADEYRHNGDGGTEDDGDTGDDRPSVEDGTSDRSSGDAASFVWTTDLSADAADDDGDVDADREEAVAVGDDRNGDESSERPSTLSPERYLLAGETVTERVDVGRGWVAATTHRVLVFDPESDGRRFEAVDRPNVAGVRTTGGGDPTPLAYLPRAVVYSVLLLGGGLIARSYGLRSLFSVSPGATEMPGVGGVLSMLSLAGALMGLLVDALLVGGVVAGLVALALAAWYLRSRRPTLVIERAGDDDVTLRLPSPAVGDRAVETLERVLAEELAATR